MSAQDFVFPSPPPPPPSLGQPIFTPSFQSPNQQGFGFNGSGGSREYGGRGRGWGRGGEEMSRGSKGGRGRGGPGSGGFSKPYGYQSNTNAGYSSSSGPHSNGSRYTQASYPQPQQGQFGVQEQYRYGPQSSPCPQIGSGNAYQHNPGQRSIRNAPTAPPMSVAYASTPMGLEKGRVENRGPSLMGPRIRTGFDCKAPDISSQTAAQSVLNISYQDRGRPTTFSRGERDSKRVRGNAFGSGRNAHARPMAPPAVPAFGAPLVGMPSEASDIVQKPKKKKRKHNQLGLTPKTEDHESSEEEDIDEESKLAAMQSSGTGSALQFTYKGQLATLKSPSDIAAWIEERKKRFPTKKRAEEAAKRREQQQKAAQETKELKNKERKKVKTGEYKKNTGPDEAAKAKTKAEKLRKQYEKAQKRVAEIEAKANNTGRPIHSVQEPSSKAHPSVLARDRSSREASGPPSIQSRPTYAEPLNFQEHEKFYTEIAPSQRSSSTVAVSAENPAEPREITAPGWDSFIPISQSLASISTHYPSEGEKLPDLGVRSLGHSSDPLQADVQSTLSSGTGTLEELGDSISSDSSYLSSSDDDIYTSSSGSSSEDSTPLEITSNRGGPERVAPSKTRTQKAICNGYLAKGRCLRGDRCKYRHELPQRGSRGFAEDRRKQNGLAGGESRVERLSLYQRMLAQQRERDDELLMQHIIFLGQHGALDDG